MHHRKSPCHLIQGAKATRRKLAEGPFFKLCHEPRDLPGRRKRKTTLAHVYAPVPARPRVDATQPDSMDPAHILRREAMALVIDSDQLVQGPELLSCLYLIHLALEFDSQEVLENPTARTRLELRLHQSRRSVPSTALQPGPSPLSGTGAHSVRRAASSTTDSEKALTTPPISTFRTLAG